MYHADEVRDFKQVPKGESVKVSEKELELGIRLIDRLTSEEFHRRIMKTTTESACSQCWTRRAKARKS
jgi:hypothetical protein